MVQFCSFKTTTEILVEIEGCIQYVKDIHYSCGFNGDIAETNKLLLQRQFFKKFWFTVDLQVSR